MEYTGNFNYEDDCFFELKPDISQDIHSSIPSAYTTNIELEKTQKALSSPLISSNNSSSSGFVISFSPTHEEAEDIAAMINSENACQESLGGNNNSNNNVMYKRSTVQAQDHVIAERKRREKMGELFISLSKIVPGLKKLDKSSILGDTIKYMKDLQEQVKVLEETKKNISSASKENVQCNDQVLGSNIKARILDKSVLINIHCNKQDGILGRVLFQMEQLHLSVHDIRIMPFGRANLEISILAEMENGCCITVQDIVKVLQINILDQVQSVHE